MTPGDRLTLTIERPAAGGRMIARHDGQVVLVSLAIPGEVVEAEVEKVQRATAWARTVRVCSASPDREDGATDPMCGGNVLAHIRYERQLAIKGDIVRDALARIGRLAPPRALDVVPSPIDGYRMRARLHVRGTRIGFFREGTHELCAPGPTRQLLPATLEALAGLERTAILAEALPTEIELAENVPAAERAFHLVTAKPLTSSHGAVLATLPGVSGVSYAVRGAARPTVVYGSTALTDVLAVPSARGEVQVTLRRHVQAFFQGNRYLLAKLVGAVIDAVPPGRALDLYAGVGLFAVALAERGDVRVVAVEGDRAAAADLRVNAAAVGETIEAREQPVEAYLASGAARGLDTIVVDPPRTGMTRDAMAGVIAASPERIVYVSCDVATFARDARRLVDAGYRLTDLRAFDLFPQTAHVETLATFDRGRSNE